jgi:hypothetical protein
LNSRFLVLCLVPYGGLCVLCKPPLSFFRRAGSPLAPFLSPLFRRFSVLLLRFGAAVRCCVFAFAGKLLRQPVNQSGKKGIFSMPDHFSFLPGRIFSSCQAGGQAGNSSRPD